MSFFRYLILGMLTFLSVTAQGIISGEPSSPPPKEDEDTIFKLIQDFERNWNKHDSKAMAQAWSEDGSLLNPWGRWAKNRAEVEQIFAREQEGPFRDSKLVQSIVEIKMLAPTIVLIDAECKINDIYAPGYPHTFSFHISYVLEKQNEVWHIISAHAFQLISPLSKVKN